MIYKLKISNKDQRMSTQISHTKKDSKKRKPTYKEIANVYAKKAANKSSTCMALGICRHTLDNWRKKSDKLNEMMTEVEEQLIDFSESKLLEKIQDGDLTAIIFHLKTKGKKRGYVEGVEIEEHRSTNLDLSGLSKEEMDTVFRILKKANK